MQDWLDIAPADQGCVRAAPILPVQGKSLLP